MSRSYKKSPVFTDGGRGKRVKWCKRQANKAVRRYNKNIANFLSGKAYRKLYQSYDIHDQISYWTKADAVQEYEHPHWWYMPYRNEWWHRWMDFKNTKEFEQYWAKYYRRK